MIDEGRAQTSAPDFAHLIQTNRLEMVDVLGPIVGFLTAARGRRYLLLRAAGHDPSRRVCAAAQPPRPGNVHCDFRRSRRAGRAAGRFRLGADCAGPGLPRPRQRKARVPQPLAASGGLICRDHVEALGWFFREVGVPVRPQQPSGPPSPETVRHFLDTAQRYGYWNGSPEVTMRPSDFSCRR